MTTHTRFRDCLKDPGPLTGDVALLAVSIHHRCPELCRWRWRALAAIDTEYDMHPAPVDVNDAHFADRLRTAAQLTQQAWERRPASAPVPPHTTGLH